MKSILTKSKKTFRIILKKRENTGAVCRKEQLPDTCSRLDTQPRSIIFLRQGVDFLPRVEKIIKGALLKSLFFFRLNL